MSVPSVDELLGISAEYDSSDADSVATGSEESALDEYEVYPIEEELPSNVMSSDSDSDSESSSSAIDEDIYPLYPAESAPSIIHSALPSEPESILEPLNLAFASWIWTHGISVEAFNGLQQLLHSDLFDTTLPFLRSSKGIRSLRPANPLME